MELMNVAHVPVVILEMESRVFETLVYPNLVIEESIVEFRRTENSPVVPVLRAWLATVRFALFLLVSPDPVIQV